MHFLERIRKYENLHIVFWLIKDTCWMLELKYLGTAVMFPTIGLAVFILVKTIGTKDVYLNTAIFFWIAANSFWMMMEFFNNNLYKDLALIPFILGLLFVVIFYVKGNKAPKTSS